MAELKAIVAHATGQTLQVFRAILWELKAFNTRPPKPMTLSQFRALQDKYQPSGGDLFLALPREVRDQIYDYHINNPTVIHHISDAVPHDERGLYFKLTELHFFGLHFWRFGLGGVWREFKEARGLSPLSALYDSQISPELESAYLRCSTFHTTLKCGKELNTLPGDPLRQFFESLGPEAAGQVRNLQLRVVIATPASFEDLDPGFEEYIVIGDDVLHELLGLNPRMAMRACAAELAGLLMDFGFCGRIALMGEFADSREMFNPEVVKQGLEVAEAAFHKGKGKTDVIREVSKGKAMNDVMAMPNDAWIVETEADIMHVEEQNWRMLKDSWRVVRVDFSKKSSRG